MEMLEKQLQAFEHRLDMEDEKAFKKLQEVVDVQRLKVMNEKLLERFQQENARMLKRLSDDSDRLVQLYLNEGEVVVLGKLQGKRDDLIKMCRDDMKCEMSKRISEIDKRSMSDTLKHQLKEELKEIFQGEFRSVEQKLVVEQNREEENVQDTLMLEEISQVCDTLQKEFSDEIENEAKKFSSDRREAVETKIKDEMKKVMKKFIESVNNAQMKRQLKSRDGSISDRLDVKVESKIEEFHNELDEKFEKLRSEKLDKVVLSREQTQQVVRSWWQWFKDCAISLGSRMVEFIKSGIE